MTPQTNDAYNGALRDIVFPAGILQPPVFDPNADMAINYGATGSIIGHELTHGFDDQGRKIDADGTLRDWCNQPMPRPSRPARRLSLNGHPAPVLDGFTGDQRVFLGWAQAWRGKVTDDYVKQQVVSDPHSRRRFRVNGPLPNIDAWYTAFDVKPGDSLYVAPEHRVGIW